MLKEFDQAQHEVLNTKMFKKYITQQQRQEKVANLESGEEINQSVGSNDESNILSFLDLMKLKPK